MGINMKTTNTNKHNSCRQSFFMALALFLCCAIIVCITGQQNNGYASSQNNTQANSVKAAATATSGSAVSSGSAVTSKELRGVWVSFLSYSNKGGKFI